MKDMEYLPISENDIDKTESQLKTILATKISEKALSFLKEKASTHSKVRSEIYTDMKGKEYLYNEKITPDLAQLLFKFRTRMFNVKNNFRNNYKLSNIQCPLCNTNDDTQEHLFECESIKQKEAFIVDSQSRYEDIFDNDIHKLYDIAVILKRKIEIRRELIDPED